MCVVPKMKHKLLLLLHRMLIRFGVVVAILPLVLAVWPLPLAAAAAAEQQEVLRVTAAGNHDHGTLLQSSSSSPSSLVSAVRRLLQEKQQQEQQRQHRHLLIRNNTNEGDYFSVTDLFREALSVGRRSEHHHRQQVLQRSLQSNNNNNANMHELCRLLEDQFAVPVSCTCAGSLQSAVSITCDYDETICATGAHSDPLVLPSDTIGHQPTMTTTSKTTCGRPMIGVSIGVGSTLFSATACVRNYTKDGIRMDNTCVAVDMCPAAAAASAAVHDDSNSNSNNKNHHHHRPRFCGCTVNHGTGVCGSCTVCGDDDDDGAAGIAFDCGNLNAEAVSTDCRPVGMDVDLSDPDGKLVGFVPDFDGFCSQLERALHDRVRCDCSATAGGPSFDIACQTKGVQCSSGSSNSGNGSSQYYCGKTRSLVTVKDNEIDRVTACTDYEPPTLFDFRETCTTVQLCNNKDKDHKDNKNNNNNNNNNNRVVCGCAATYDGETCQSCTVCNDAGTSVRVDCSNVHEWAVLRHCQPLTADSAYEFIPRFDMPPLPPRTDTATTTTTSTAATTGNQTVRNLLAAVLLPMVVTTAMLLTLWH